MGQVVLGDLRYNRPPLLVVVRLTDRREVIDHYLRHELNRNSRRRLDTSGLRYDDSNGLDRFLRRKRLKFGVKPGFRKWAFVSVAWDDLMDCAVVERLSSGQRMRNLGALVSSGFLDDWEPVTANPAWHTVIREGLPLPPSLALVLRPAIPSEGARYYVEDGSGRAAYLAAHRPNASVVANAYLGFDPDPSSNWLASNLESGYFVRNAERFQSVDDILGVAD